jgi:hypothetical protein
LFQTTDEPGWRGFSLPPLLLSKLLYQTSLRGGQGKNLKERELYIYKINVHTVQEISAKFDGSLFRFRENLREYIHNSGKTILTFAKESPNAKQQ